MTKALFIRSFWAAIVYSLKYMKCYNRCVDLMFLQRLQ
jgi:hypothetical protein